MDLTKCAVLVTGGAGFIGSHLVEKLANLAHSVRIADNLSTGCIKNIEPILQRYTNVQFVWADINQLDTCRQLMKGIHLVCHQAALGSVPRSIKDPLASHQTNVNGFVNLLIAAKECNIKRIVYASSSSVYGSNKDNLKTESNTGVPLSPYAVTKYVDELYATVFGKTYQMECIGLRYFNVFGPRQNPKGCYAAVIPKFIKAMLVNEPIVIYGDGSVSRDFTYVDNVVQANVLALTTTNVECHNQVFNVGTECSTSIHQLYATLLSKTASQSSLQYSTARQGDVAYSKASVYKSKTLLNYQPTVYLDTGLQLTIEYYKNHP